MEKDYYKKNLLKMIPHSRPTITQEDVRAIKNILNSNQLTTGQVVNDFEKKFADFIGVNYTSAVNSGTSALHLSLIALEIKKK